MQKKYRVVHYINQFFAQIGGEEAANSEVEARAGAVGPGLALAAALGDQFEIAATIVCGDNHLAENLPEVTAQIVELVKSHKPDLFFSGPAYAAGRYGVGCGALCAAVKNELGIPAVTAMSANNPGVEMYRKDLYILKTGDNARTMREDIRKMAAFASNLLSGQGTGNVPAPQEEYFLRGWSRLAHSPKRSADRAIDMLLQKIRGEAFVTEVGMSGQDDVPPAPGVAALAKACVVMITDGGLYPAGNPDRIPPQNPSVFGAYPVESMDRLDSGAYMISHNGYDSSFALADPNRLVPLDAMRTLEREGVIGKVHEKYLSTTGLVTTVANSTKIGREMAAYIKNHHINAAILTST